MVKCCDSEHGKEIFCFCPAENTGWELAPSLTPTVSVGALDARSFTLSSQTTEAQHHFQLLTTYTAHLPSASPSGLLALPHPLDIWGPFNVFKSFLPSKQDTQNLGLSCRWFPKPASPFLPLVLLLLAQESMNEFNHLTWSLPLKEKKKSLAFSLFLGWENAVRARRAGEGMSKRKEWLVLCGFEAEAGREGTQLLRCVRD